MGDMATASMATNVASDQENRVSNHLYLQYEQQSEFCDVTIHYGQDNDRRLVRAHWCVIAQSPYFRCQWSLNEQRPAKVNIDKCDTGAVETAIKFLYTGKISHRDLDRKVREVVHVARVCQIEKLTELCERYINETDVCVHNCIDLLDIASSCKLSSNDHILTFIVSNLINVIDIPSNSSTISTEIMQLIVSRAVATDIRRSVIMKFCQTWARSDINRQDYLANVTCLKCGFLGDNISHRKDCEIYLGQDTLLGDSVVGNDRQFQSIDELDHVSRRIPQPTTSCLNHIDAVLVVANTKQNNERMSFFASLYCKLTLFAYVVQDDRWATVATMPNDGHSFNESTVVCVDTNGHTLFTLCDTVFKTHYYGDTIPVTVKQLDLTSESWSELKVQLRKPECREVRIKNIVAVKSQLFFIATEKSSDNPKGVLLFTGSEYDDFGYSTLFQIKPRLHKLRDINAVVIDGRYLVVMCVILQVKDTTKEIKIAVRDLITCETKCIKDTHMHQVSTPERVEEMLECMFAHGNSVIIAHPNQPWYRLINVGNATVSIIDGDIMLNVWMNDHFKRDTESPWTRHTIQCGSGHNVVPVLHSKTSDSTQTLHVFDFENLEWCKAPSLPYNIVHNKPVHAKVLASWLKCPVMNCKHDSMD